MKDYLNINLIRISVNLYLALIFFMVTFTVFANPQEITLKPQINMPVVSQNTRSNETARLLCRQQACCIYNDQFYSEGAIVTLNNNIILQCSRDANVAGAGAVKWTQLK